MIDFHPLRVDEVRRETPTSVSVRFAIPEPLAEVYRFRPGQHVTIRHRLGVGEELRRTYSICSGPDEVGLQIAIKHVSGGVFSTWVMSHLHAGMVLDVMPPAGRFTLKTEPEAGPRHALGIVAGAGITPIFAMLRHALEQEPSMRFTLVYGNRSLDEIMFRDAIDDLKDLHLGRFDVLHILSRSGESDIPLLEGRITPEKINLIAKRVLVPGEPVDVYLCGPGSLIRDTRTALFALGIPRDRVHHEFFAAGGGAFRTPAPEAVPAVAAPVVDTGPESEVVAIIDGIRHRFAARAGESVIDAASRAGVRIPFACKGGMCCTCRAQVLEGSAPMRVNYSLEPWEVEKGYVLTCQAVPAGERVVLDYDQM